MSPEAKETRELNEEQQNEYYATLLHIGKTLDTVEDIEKMFYLWKAAEVQQDL